MSMVFFYPPKDFSPSGTRPLATCGRLIVLFKPEVFLGVLPPPLGQPFLSSSVRPFPPPPPRFALFRSPEGRLPCGIGD